MGPANSGEVETSVEGLHHKPEGGRLGNEAGCPGMVSGRGYVCCSSGDGGNGSALHEKKNGEKRELKMYMGKTGEGG